MNRQGIYIIKNTVTGKVYVGSSRNVLDRWANHKALLRKKKHHSIKLQRSWDKHGSEAFHFLLVESVDDTEKLLEREQVHIDQYESYKPGVGYNMLPKAGSGERFEHPPSDCRKGLSPGTKREPKGEVLQVRLTPEQRKKLEQIAESKAVTMAQVLRNYIDRLK